MWNLQRYDHPRCPGPVLDLMPRSLSSYGTSSWWPHGSSDDAPLIGLGGPFPCMELAYPSPPVTPSYTLDGLFLVTGSPLSLYTPFSDMGLFASCLSYLNIFDPP